MAQRVRVHIEDDIDGGPADETVTFGLDGTAFEIDLSAKNAAKLRKSIAAYVKAGRRTGRVSARVHGRLLSPRSEAADEAAAIRKWAQENGYVVNARGRIPTDVREAYEASN